jgi:hypothetical protein
MVQTKNSFKNALKVFKYLTVLFSIAFWFYIFFDDYVFTKKYGINIEGIRIWLAYFFIYLLGFAFYFWLISSTVILIYHKLLKRK